MNLATTITALLLGVALVASAGVTLAQPDGAPGAAPSPGASAAPPAPSAAAPAPPDAAQEEALAKAKELFKSGVTLFNAGDMERALDYFLRSRAAFASAKNTINAAICLDRLGRFDEALELYEETLTKFASSLDDESRAAIAPAMTLLRQKVGSINVAANVEGAVLVDGRSRGKLPLTGPLRVLGGKHVVRVLKDGYAAAEATVQVEIGQTAEVDLRLKPLAAAGLLRVEDPANPESEVFVDRVAVGVSPWEGTLGPGKHLVWVKKGDLGTAPAEVTVVQGQTVLSRVKSVPLGVSARLEPAPATAQIVLDGVVLGAGVWEGRLPVGAHTVSAQEPGYFSKSASLSIPGPGGAPVRTKLSLVIDPKHPRWPKAGPSGVLWVSAFGGYVWAPSLRGGANDACPAHCSGKQRARGFLAGARAGYRFPLGLSIELGGGYLSAIAAFSRTLDTRFGSSAQYPVRYYVDDDIGLGGVFAVTGASYRMAFGKHFTGTGRLNAGVLFARSVDALSATGRTPESPPVPFDLVGKVGAVRSTAILVAPELAAGYSIGAFEIGAALALYALVTGGPDLNSGDLQLNAATRATRTPATPDGTISTVPNTSLVASERAYGSGVLILAPQVTVAYSF